MTNSLLLCLCLVLSFSMQAQFYYDFEEEIPPDLLGFSGDTDDFVIESGTLQLRAVEAGNSFIYLNTNLPDSIEYGISFEMDFSPSNNNKLRIYLQLDTFDLDIASGYLIEIGENGSEDKIKFIRMIQGESLVIAEGNPGIFSIDPVITEIRIRKDQNGFWELLVKDSETELFITDLELFDSTIKRYYNQYIGLECIYTSTRKDKFYFDEFYMREIVPDTLPPVCTGIDLLDDHTIELLFDEILDEQFVKLRENYQVVQGGFHPAEVYFNQFKPNRVILEFDQSFSSREAYTMSISQIRDLKGNVLDNAQEMSFYYAISVQKRHDLVINEVLFDPVGERCDFLELYNRSEDILDLSGLVIQNNTRENSVNTIAGDMDVFPGEYLLLCEDTAFLDIYRLPEKLNFYPMDLPAFNNDEGNATLLFGEMVIDSFNYHEDMHFQLIDDSEGISLERISPEALTNDPTNWQSASGVEGGATPGRQNSQYHRINYPSKKYFDLPEAVFSPDQDGFEDQLILSYALPKDGFVGSVSVFDLGGNFVKTLINNRILGTEGIVTWKGLDENGRLCPVGPYVIYCSAFHESGATYQQKLVGYLFE